jgi:hypothetical protein
MKEALETHRFSRLESLIAPIVVFTTLKAGGQLGAEAKLAVESRRLARMSIQGSYKVHRNSMKVMNIKIKGPNYCWDPFTFGCGGRI